MRDVVTPPRERSLAHFRYFRFLRHMALVLLAPFAFSCSSDTTDPVDPVDDVARIQVVTETTGEDLDIDGYSVTLNESASMTIGIADTATFPFVNPGPNSLTLSLVDFNCSVPAGATQSVIVRAGETATAVFVVTCEYIPGDPQYDVDENAPRADVDLIKSGMDRAQSHLDQELAGGIPRRTRQGITVRIAATGQGNQEEGGFGACCTAYAKDTVTGESVIRPFFDVKHPEWDRDFWDEANWWSLETEHLFVVVHEYTHGWHHALGCATQFWQPLGDWLMEGMASFVGYAPLIDEGRVSQARVDNFMVESAEYLGLFEYPLWAFERSPPGLWAGHYGYIAVRQAVEAAPNGSLAVREICEEIADGALLSDAFEAAFGEVPRRFLRRVRSVAGQPPQFDRGVGIVHTPPSLVR